MRGCKIRSGGLPEIPEFFFVSVSVITSKGKGAYLSTWNRLRYPQRRLLHGAKGASTPDSQLGVFVPDHLQVALADAEPTTTDTLLRV